MEYIEAHFEHTLSVPDMARQNNMSVSNFYLLFKKYMNVSPVEYRNIIRVKHAMFILESNKNISIEVLSQMLGYDSVVYFRRVFKKVTGKTPTEYKKSNLEI